jgi:hypothetical protein
MCGDKAHGSTEERALTLGQRDTELTAFFSLTEHSVNASRPQKKRIFVFSGPFGPQTTKKRRQAR